MRKVVELLRLRAEGCSVRQMADSLGVPRSTVADYVRRIERAGLSWPLDEDVDENGIAPLKIASGTPSQPSASVSIISPHAMPQATAVECFAPQNDQENDPLEDQHGCIRQIVRTLEQSTACTDPAQSDRRRNDGDGIVARDERNQDAAPAIADMKRAAGPVEHGGNF